MSIATPQARSYASYGAQFSGCYDVIFPRDMVTDAETSWLRTVLPARGRRVVELGVGNGRVALPLAAAFAADRTPVEYIGIDISAEMLHGLAHHDVDGLVTPLRLDIASDDYPPDADAILCVCGTISMLTDCSAQQGVFDRAFAALRKGGVFVVETHNAELVRQMHPHPHRSWAVALPGERRMLATFSDLIDGHNWQLEHCLIDNGSATFLHEDSRVTTLAELDAYARNAGLLPIRHSGGLNGDEIEYRPSRNRQSPLLVFENSLVAVQEYWQPILSKLEIDAATLTYDRPGYGASIPAPGSRSLESHAADLDDLIRNFSQDREVWLIGHSLGGYLIRKAAPQLTTKIAGLILLDPTTATMTSAEDAEADREAMSSLTEGFPLMELSLRGGGALLLNPQVWSIPADPAASHRVSSVYRDHRIWRAGREEWDAAVREIINERVDQATTVAPLEVPTLVITASTSVSLHPVSADTHRALAAQVPEGRHLVVRATHDGGHRPALGAHRRRRDRPLHRHPFGNTCRQTPRRRLDGGGVMRKTRRLPVAAITTDVISAGLAIWVLATVAGQHPNHNFDRIRIFDRASVFLPNWRFFAPIPASKDVVLVHRVRRSGNVSDWEYTHTAPSRTLLHVFWFPQRRVDKGVFDVVGRFLRTVERIGTGYESSAEYRLLRNFVKRRVQELNPDANDLDSFQFAIIREAGYESEPVEEIFVSRKEDLRDEQVAARPD